MLSLGPILGASRSKVYFLLRTGPGPRVPGVALRYMDRAGGRGRSLPTMPPPPAPAPTKDRVRSKPPARAHRVPCHTTRAHSPLTMNTVRVKGQRWVRSRGLVPPPPLAGELPAFPKGDVQTLPPREATLRPGQAVALWPPWHAALVPRQACLPPPPGQGARGVVETAKLARQRDPVPGPDPPAG